VGTAVLGCPSSEARPFRGKPHHCLREPVFARIGNGNEIAMSIKEWIKLKEVEAKLDGQKRWWMRITHSRIIARYLRQT
jgi:hypothetical protein